MQYSSTIRGRATRGAVALATLLLLAFSAGAPAAAATNIKRTPLIAFADTSAGSLVCAAENIGSAPIQVLILVKDETDAGFGPAANSVIDPGKAFVHTPLPLGQPYDVSYRCYFEILEGKPRSLRGTLTYRGVNGDVSVVTTD